MYINELKLEQNKNLGNYESRKVSATISIAEGENLQEAVKYLNTVVGNVLEGKQVEKAKSELKVAVEVEAPVEPLAEKKVVKKKTTKKKVAKKKEVEEAVTATIDEAKAAARSFYGLTKSRDKVESVIEEVSGVRKLGNISDESVLGAIVQAFSERM